MYFAGWEEFDLNPLRVLLVLPLSYFFKFPFILNFLRNEILILYIFEKVILIFQ